MGKTRKIVMFFLIFSLGISLIFANYFRVGNNWDANVSSSEPANDEWILDGRLDLEDSFTPDYSLGKRGNITGTISSDLYGNFNINNSLMLEFKSNSNIPVDCGTSLEVYSISGTISSDFWGEMSIENDSFFCSNQYAYINFKSDSLGDKEIGNSSQTDFIVDNFDKQKISISGIVKLKGDENEILSRESNAIDDIYIDSNKKVIAKTIVNKNIVKNTRGRTPETINTLLTNISNTSSKEKIYYYDYTGKTETIQFDGNNYINKGEILQIGNTNKVGITGKNTVIVESGNVYIKNDLYNTNDNSSLLVIVAKRDRDTGNGGNIYIDPSVTNIDAVLIADGSLISFDGDKILKINTFTNKLRNQLLIYGSTMTSNTVGSNILPYGADLYEKLPDNKMENSIYDLANLRTFNINYGSGGTVCSDSSKVVPINGNGGYKLNAWAGKRECYNDDPLEFGLRGSDKLSPVIIIYNSAIKSLNPNLLKNN